MEIFFVKRPKKVYLFFLTLYVTSSVINWFPLVSPEIIRSIKYLLFVYIFLYEFINFRFKYPSGYLSPIGFLLIFISMSFGFYSSFNISSLIDVLMPFLIVWSFNFNKEFYYKVFYRSSLVVSFICLMSLISFVTGAFDIFSGDRWGTYFSQSAFAGYTTGYSNSLFLFVVFLVYYHRLKKCDFFSIETFCIIVIITSQFTSGGRGGLLASLLVFSFGYRISKFYKIILLLLFLLNIGLEDLKLKLRIKSEYKTEMSVNDISSGRLESNTYYFNKFLENPIFGYGFGDKPELNEFIYEPHIVWLRNSINGGVFYLLALILIFINIYFVFKKNKRNKTRDEIFLFNNLFFSTLVITFLEPNYIIGSVQGEILYWILISLMLKKNKNNFSVVNAN